MPLRPPPACRAECFPGRQQCLVGWCHGTEEGREEKARILAAARLAASRIKGEAEADIEREIKAAKEDLMREIAEISSSLAEDLIRANINEQDQQRLVEEYLTKVVDH